MMQYLGYLLTSNKDSCKDSYNVLEQHEWIYDSAHAVALTADKVTGSLDAEPARLSVL